MTPSPEQLAAAQQGQDIRFAMDGVELVIVRSDIYDAYKSQSDADHQELRQRLALSSAANGWDEPGMEAYDTYPATP